MKFYNKLNKLALPLCTVAVLAAGCTKLDESLNDTLTSDQVAAQPGSTELLVAGAYTDLTGLMHGQSQLFALQENAADEALVPTRGGDWDDNGVWRVLHAHNWTADHQYVLDVFNNLNKLNFDATNVLLFQPTASQEAQARFLRALSLYHLLDLYGQYPIRQPGEDLRLAPEVKTGAGAIDFIISELNAALPNLAAENTNPAVASQDAARFLLMRCFLNKGAFLNRQAPTFDASDMEQVITLGNQIINSGRYSITTNYFDNFSPDNHAKSTERIFSYQNEAGVEPGNGDIQARWYMTLHYNSWTPRNPNAGWNGFSTISDFYNSFNTTPLPTAYGMRDSIFDSRIGLRYYRGATNISGLRPGFLVGQQYNENGQPIQDRKGNPLAYTPEIAPNQIETGTNLEVTGIRVIKYVPDYANYDNNAGNDLQIFRYADAWLMVAEARMRSGDETGGLEMVNQLRQLRGAAPLAAPLAMANPNNVQDPNTFLSERGRELYWESVRRTDLIRFGVFTRPWQLKPNDDDKYLLFPIPNQALAANPNLKQNAGY